jgi:diguanylate cyclase (GGDEF)-like protein/PAS domain S-box-containing protein
MIDTDALPENSRNNYLASTACPAPDTHNYLPKFASNLNFPQELIESHPDLFWEVDIEGKWSYLNSACNAIYGIAPEGLLGRLFTERVDSDQLPYDLQIFQRLLAGDSVNNHITKHLRVDGQPVILAYTARSRRNQNGEVIGTYGTAIEVTGMVAQLSGQAQRDALREEAAATNPNSANAHPWERRQLERQLEILKQANSRLHAKANIDDLTGCLRRNAFIDQFKKWQLKTQAQESISLIMIDIDNFKLINDTYGHTRGDEALKQVGDALLAQLGDQAFAARFGGDEFVIAIPSQLPDETISWFSAIQDGLRSQAKRASDFPEGILMSAGILYCASGIELIFEDVIHELDKLLYEAKSGGRNCFISKEISE